VAAVKEEEIRLLLLVRDLILVLYFSKEIEQLVDRLLQVTRPYYEEVLSRYGPKSLGTHYCKRLDQDRKLVGLVYYYASGCIACRSAASDTQSPLYLQTDPVKPSHVQGLIICRILCNASLATTRIKTSGFPLMAPAIYNSVNKSPDAELLPRNGTTVSCPELAASRLSR
jgi:hypothetical protein